MDPIVERKIVSHARKLITRRANWTRFAEAEDKHGEEVDCLSVAAVRFCLRAQCAARPVMWRERRDDILDRLQEMIRKLAAALERRPGILDLCSMP